MKGLTIIFEKVSLIFEIFYTKEMIIISLIIKSYIQEKMFQRKPISLGTFDRSLDTTNKMCI